MENKEEEAAPQYQWIRAVFEHKDGVQLEFVHNIVDKEIIVGIFDSWLKYRDKLKQYDDPKVEDFCRYIATLRVAGIGDYYALPWTTYQEFVKEAKENQDE